MAKLRTRQRGKTWSYNFDAYTLDGKRKVIEKGGFKTQKEAYDAGTKAYASYKNGNISIVSEKIRCEDFFAEWLKMKEKEVRPNTYVSCEYAIKRLLPHIGDVKLQNLRPRDIDNAIQALADRGLSYGAITVTLSKLKNALDYAVYPCELIQTNPAHYVKTPKRALKEIIKRSIITKAKLGEILTAYPFGHPYHIPIIIAYHTGMRLGEVLGLCWDVVDLNKGKIRVVRQLQYIPKKGASFCEPKTKTSKRDILLDYKLIGILKKWRLKQKGIELSEGGSYLYSYENTDGVIWQINKNQEPPKGLSLRSLVCTGKQGEFIRRVSLMEALRKLGINFHSLRHTHATNLIQCGAIAKDVAARLGHADATITQNLYTHNTEEMQKSTVKIFENLLL